MSYRRAALLTVLIIALSSVLSAQNAAFQDAFRRLASPTSAERTAAITAIVDLKGDIGPQLRIAFKNANVVERCGLLEASEFREDGALVIQALKAMSEKGADTRVAMSALAYLRAVPEAKLAGDEKDLDEDALAALADLRQFRLRREIVVALLDAAHKPGKYLDQFESLRARDKGALHAQLLALVYLEPAFVEPFADGCGMRFRRGIEPERLHSSSWRKFLSAQGMFEQAWELLHDGPARQALKTPGAPLLAAVEVAHDMRTAAVRALAVDSPDETLCRTLYELHLASRGFELPPVLRAAVGLDAFRTEIELALARMGEGELLQARIANLRNQVQRAAAQVNINARVAARPDINARNEVAHLLLRSGDAAGAEAEWTAVIELARASMRGNRDPQRGSVASLLGTAYYNLACAQSLQLKLTRAGQSLEAARAHGYRDFYWMLEDGDLASLRATANFRDWYRRVAPPACVDRLDAGR